MSSFIRRFASALLVSYWTLYLTLNWFPRELAEYAEMHLAPGGSPIVKAYEATWPRVVIWIGQHVLHVTGRLRYFSGGNSDGLFSFVQLACIAAVAVVAAGVWSVVGRRPLTDAIIPGPLRVALRYALATSLLTYGMIKAIPSQFFGLPSLVQLVKPFGDFTPFEVLWTFMGTSPGYTVFTGVIEVAGGMLLLFRRTTTLGAIVAAGALVNVCALDFAYGVPEKLDVLHYLAIAVILAAPDVPRLAGLLVLNRHVPMAVPADGVYRPMIARRIAKVVVVVYVLATAILLPFRLRADYPAHGPLYGIYDVATFTANGRTLEPLPTDPVRWRRVVFASEEGTWIEMMDNSWHFYATEYQPKTSTLTLTASTRPSVLHYDLSDSGALILSGGFDTSQVGARLARVEGSRFRLVQSRFRWINGEP